MNKRLFFMIPVFLFFCTPSSAEYYKYVDEKGNILFTDDISSIPKDKRKKTKEYYEVKSKEKNRQNRIEQEETELENSMPQQAEKVEKAREEAARELKNEKDSLMLEYQTILDEKKKLEENKPNSNAKAMTRVYNKNIRDINGRIRIYESKIKKFNKKIDTYVKEDKKVKNQNEGENEEETMDLY